MKLHFRPNALHTALIATLLMTACSKQETPPATETAVADTAPTETAAAPAFPERPLFGDTHLHTSYSMDAGTAGARLGPREAYRFALGEELTASSNQPVKLSRPLDFLVVADHSDGMGFFPLLNSGDPDLLSTEKGKNWYDMIKAGRNQEAAFSIIQSFSTNTMPKGFPVPGTKAYTSAWNEIMDAADEFNQPGKFTAFIGYEWTVNTGGNNLHRNILFRAGKDKASMVEPFTTLPPLGSDNPVDLWKWMAATEEKTGSQVLAIAHNGNLSNGTMFPTVEAFGKKLDKDYVETRAKRERIYEMTQMKGDGETHPYLSPNDEFADFERWDKANLAVIAPHKNDMFESEYARSALKNGLKLEKQLGTNPYKFGMIGSTDSHTGLATADENNFFGKTSVAEPSPERLTATFMENQKIKVKIHEWEIGAAGYAAVWATENTRESIFDAMQRKETYATTGPRMTVRLFGGYDFEAADANAATLAKTGYAKGVPMGGDLNAAPAGKAPTFLVAAMKDAIGANLDRYQIVKGWMDKDGKLHEKVYDVAWSAGRSVDPKTGKLPAVGDTVNVADASYTNSIGAAELVAVWKDPDFDPSVSAFYYGRVLEIPTPRWTAFDVKRFKNTPLAGTRMSQQERAYTSPIWYTPQ